MPTLVWFQPFFPTPTIVHLTNNTLESSIPTLSGWQTEPRARGTWSIVSSCVFTLSLCVYTAIHLNVPQRASTRNQLFWSRTKWVLVGILAPELVVFAAWRQWTSARRLTLDLAILKEEPLFEQLESSGPSFLANWSMIHSFFAEMGGYTIELKNGRHVTLTAKGLFQLVELGYELPPFTRADIEDRSKADFVTKLLTCTQATYMIIQVIGRRAQNLPITLLEINTLGHVVCALAMFMFWFKKPWNVDVPAIITADWLVKQTHRVTHKTDGFWNTEFWEVPRDHQAKIHRRAGSLVETVTIREDSLFLVFIERLRELDKFDLISARITAFAPAPFKFFMLRGPPSTTEQWEENNIILVLVDIDSDPCITPERIQSVIQGTSLWPSLITHLYRCSEPFDSLWPTYATRLAHGEALQVYLTLNDVVNWDRAWKSLCASGALASASEWAKWKSEFASQCQAEEYTTLRASNWPTGRGQLQMGHRLLGISLLALATGLYGGLHLLLWSSYFPSHPERLLWRTCASIIAVSGLIAGYLILLVSHETDPLPVWLVPVIWPLRKAFSLLIYYLGPGRSATSIGKFSFIITCVVAPCYCAARAYIVVECFVSLRRLPVEAYTTLVWTKFLPHV